MTAEPADNASAFAFHWLAEHLASVDEQIRLAESVKQSGGAALQVDLLNYISLHQYARELLLLLDSLERSRRTAESRVKALELARALRAYRRPVGRPRKVRLAALGTGLLGAFTEPEKPEPRKGGRPRENPEEFWAELNAAVVEAWANRNGDSAKLNVSVGLKAFITDYTKSKNYTGKEATQKIRATHRAWYKPLMKYRRRIGQAVYAKSQNRLEKAPNFAPLLANFGRLSTANRSGTHNAATKGKHGHQTGTARARKR